MVRLDSWNSLPGATPAEKFFEIGIEKRRMLDVRSLDEMARQFGITVYLFFEEDLARNRTLESVLEEFGGFPEYERPFITVGSFLKFTRDNDPSFAQTMKEFPLMVEVVMCGETVTPESACVPYISALMPFLDELDVDGDLPR